MAEASTPSPSAAASYLRRLLERQPACLIRVHLDGVLLACNDAALGLFGVGTLGAILNTNVTDRMIAAERTKWQEFATRVWANGAASLECHLVGLEGGARPVLFQGIALNDHPDGLDSLLLNLRDQSQTHRLERSIQGERQRLTEALDAQIVDRQRREAISVELERRVEESQLALLVGQRENRVRIAVLEAELAASHAAQGTRGSARDQPPAQAGLQELASGERNRQELADLELRLRASTAEQARLRALAAEHDVQREQIAAEHRTSVDTLEESLARAGEEATLGRDQASEALAELRSQLLAEQSRLAARAEEYEREREGMSAEHQRAIADLEIGQREALAELRSQLSQTSAEQSRLAAHAEEHERERDRMGAEHQRAIADLETSQREKLAELRSQLSQTLAEQSRLAARAEEGERERDRVSAEHHRAIADLETSKREALAECEQVLTEIQLALLVRADDSAVEIECRLTDEMDQAAREKDNGERIAGLQAELSQAVSQMQTVLAHSEPTQEHSAAEDAIDRERAVPAPDEATVKLETRADSLENS